MIGKKFILRDVADGTYNRDGAGFGDGLTKMVSIISGIGHNDIGLVVVEYGRSLRDTAAMARSQSDPAWATRIAHGQVETT